MNNKEELIRDKLSKEISYYAGAFSLDIQLSRKCFYEDCNSWNLVPEEIASLISFNVNQIVDGFNSSKIYKDYCLSFDLHENSVQHDEGKEFEKYDEDSNEEIYTDIYYFEVSECWSLDSPNGKNEKDKIEKILNRINKKINSLFQSWGWGYYGYGNRNDYDCFYLHPEDEANGYGCSGDGVYSKLFHKDFYPDSYKSKYFPKDLNLFGTYS